jgi:hypothetical protein
MLVICLSQKRPDGGNGYPIPPGLTVALSIGVSFATADVDLVHPFRVRSALNICYRLAA